MKQQSEEKLDNDFASIEKVRLVPKNTRAAGSYRSGRVDGELDHITYGEAIPGRVVRFCVRWMTRQGS